LGLLEILNPNFIFVVIKTKKTYDLGVMARVEISLGVFSGDDSYCSLKPRTSGVTPPNKYVHSS